jgi:hypothetical protein
VDLRVPAFLNIDPHVDPAFMVGSTRFGAMFSRSRWWAQRIFREWWQDQAHGGPVRVFRRKNGHFYTTLAIVDAHMPKRKNDALERRLRTMERDLLIAMTRIAKLEGKLTPRR